MCKAQEEMAPGVHGESMGLEGLRGNTVSALTAPWSQLNSRTPSTRLQPPSQASGSGSGKGDLQPFARPFPTWHWRTRRPNSTLPRLPIEVAFWGAALTIHTRRDRQTNADEDINKHMGKRLLYPRHSVSAWLYRPICHAACHTLDCAEALPIQYLGTQSPKRHQLFHRKIRCSSWQRRLQSSLYCPCQTVGHGLGRQT